MGGGVSIASVVASVEVRDASGRASVAPGTMKVRRWQLVEELHEPYRLDLELHGIDPALQADALVGRGITLRIERIASDVAHAESTERVVHGVVLRAVYLGHSADRTLLRVSAGPAFALLAASRGSRIVQGRSVPEIVQEVVQARLARLSRTVDVTRLVRAHAARDYCVQHRETDLAFVQRILAEDGITFVFVQAHDRETMVLVDDAAGFRSVDATLVDPGPASAPRIVLVGGERSELAGEETVAGLQWQRGVRPATVRAAAWDWKRDPPSVLASESARHEPWDFGEQALHDERRVMEGADGDSADEDVTADLAARAFAAIEAASSYARGSGNVVAFAPGHTFELEGHPHADLDRPWLLVRVVHEGDQPDVELQADEAAGGYDNRFEAVPLDRPWAPTLRDKPRIHGHQLATVVGPPGEEIHTDAHGRIKVQFAWDREAAPAGEASCWLRVVQTWAGPGFGSLFLPRVGMEVVVSFVDGDPDRPLCIGCVYDGSNRPPWPLPDERTRSGLRTRSTSDGEGGNELSFEDARGSERVHLHAQKDFDAVVRATHDVRVGGRQSIAVGADRSVSVAGSHTVSVAGNESITIEGTPKSGAPMGQTVTVIGDIQASASKTYKLVAPLGIDLVCGASVISMRPDGITLVAGSGAVLKLDAAMLAAAAGGAVQLAMDGAGKASLASVGGGSLEIADAVVASSPAGSGLRLDDGATLTSAGGARLALDGSATIGGEAVTCESAGATIVLADDAAVRSGKVEVVGGSGTIVADERGVALEGAQLSAVAANLASVIGAMIKLN